MTNAPQVAPGDTQAADKTMRSEDGGLSNRTRWLDKPVTARYCLRWFRRAMYVLLPMYVMAVFMNAWMLKLGGVTAQNSPYKDRFPTACSGFIDRAHGTPAGRTGSDNLLLKGRIRRFPLQSALKVDNQLMPCIGYAVLAGLHGRTAGDADFTDVYVDSFGEPVVSISVRYEQVLTEGRK